jgi:hypothetical protein
VSDTALIFNLLARDKASRAFANLRRNALDMGNGVTKAMLAVQAAAPAAAAAVPVVAGLGASFAGAGAAAAVFGGVVATAFAEMKTESDKVDTLREKIRQLGMQAKLAPTPEIRDKALKKQAAAILEMNARLALLPPTTRGVIVEYGNMKNAWMNFVDANKPATYTMMTRGFSIISGIIPKLQPLFDVAAVAARRLLSALLGASTGGGIDRLVAFLANQAGPALNFLGDIAKNLGTVIANVFQQFAPSGAGALEWIANMTAKWAEWSSNVDGEGGLGSFVRYIEANGPKAAEMIGQIADAATNIAKAVAPLAPVSLAVAGALTQIIAAMPPGVLTAIVAALIAYSVAAKVAFAITTAWGVATKIWAGITKIATAVQWLWNFAMTANPIGLIIIAIAALIVIIVLIATKTTWFQTIWEAVWGFIVAAFKLWWAVFSGIWLAIGEFFVGLFKAWWGLFTGFWSKVFDGVSSGWKWVTGKLSAFVSFVGGLPKKIAGAAKGLFNGIVAAAKGGINTLIGLWNRLDLGWHIGIPSWVPIIGGASFSIPDLVPDIPMLAKGGVVPAKPGGRLVIAGEGGEDEAVVPLSKLGGGPSQVVVSLPSGGSSLERLLAAWFYEAVRTGKIRLTVQNGRVQVGRA